MKKVLVIFAFLALCGLLYFGIRFCLYQSNKKAFLNKSYWAKCNNDQGVSAYEVYLCDDSTFYTEILGEAFWGTYSVNGDTLLLTGNDKNILCQAYLISTSKNKATPLDNCPYDILHFYKQKGRIEW